MLSGLFEQSSNGAKLIASIFIILISALIFSIIGIILSIPILGLDLSTLMTLIETQNESNIGFMKYLQTIISLGTFVVPPFIIAYVLNGEIVKYLSLSTRSMPLSIRACLFIV